MIDVVHQINEVQRRVGTRTLDAGEARVVTISRTYRADLADLWDACTSAERIPRWFLPVTGDLRVGGTYQLEGHAGGTIERCDPPKGFAATWEFGGNVSWIELRLSPAGDGRTRFELEHTVPVDEHWERYGPGAVGIGWELGLNGLSLHLAAGSPGAIVDKAAFEAWSASEDGKRFVTLSSEAWVEANVAGGESREVAGAAGRRTTEAYTAG